MYGTKKCCWAYYKDNFYKLCSTILQTDLLKNLKNSASVQTTHALIDLSWQKNLFFSTQSLTNFYY